MVPRGRYSVSRTPSLSQKMIIIIFLADHSWRSGVGVCSPNLFQISWRSGVGVCSPNLFQISWLPADWDDRSGEFRTHRWLRCHQKTWPDFLRSPAGALMTIIDTIGTLNWCQQFQYPPCANLLHAQLIVHDLMGDGFWNGQFVSYATERDLSITHYDPFYSFDVFIGSDGWWTTHSRCIFEATFWILEFSHPLDDSTARWSRVLVNIIQLLANFDGIQPFSGEKLDDCSMLNVRHFWKMKIHGPQNVIFSYEGNEPTGKNWCILIKTRPL